jgi:hypothetical protein
MPLHSEVTSASISPKPVDWLLRWYAPGGDIQKLQRCEAACTTLAAAVSGIRQELNTAGKAAAGSFNGAAAEALSANLADLDGCLEQLDTHLRTAADGLHAQAAIKQEQQRQARDLWIMTALVSVAFAVEAGLALSVAAVDAAVVGAVEAESGALGLITRAMDGVRGLLPKTVRAQGLYSAAYVGAQFVSKAFEMGELAHPSTWGPAWLGAFDPDNYSASEVSLALMGGILYPPVYQGALKALGVADRAVSGAAAVRREAMIGFTSKVSVGAAGAAWLGGKSPADAGVWGEVAVGGGLNAIGGGAAGRWGSGLVSRIARSPVGGAFDRAFGGGGVRPEDFARRVFSAPSDVAVAVTSSPGAPPQPAAIAGRDLVAPAQPRFQPPVDGVSGEAVGGSPVPVTLWKGNVQDHPAELMLLQRRLIANGLPARVGAPWDETKGLVGWFKAGHERPTSPVSMHDHAVDAATWRALLAVPGPAQSAVAASAARP